MAVPLRHSPVWLLALNLLFASFLFLPFCSSLAVERSSTPQAVNATRFPHLHNLQRLSERIYVGAEPHEDVAFAELAELGVLTVVSVDGAKPQAAAARHHGLRYVHIPIGYDGVSEEAGKSLAQLVRSVEGPIYIHCHHGKHRGPAAAAVACIAEGTVDHKEAIEILKRSGTSSDYAGLWRDVEAYQPPAEDATLPALVEVAEVDSLTAAMAQVDRASDHLKLCQAADWQPMAEHPDISARQEALLLREGLFEAARQLTAEQRSDTRLASWFGSALRSAKELEHALEAKNSDLAAQKMELLHKSCQQCHSAYRD
ncbi:dual specificity protein phosphatase family protein [Bythopirellula goksoeyrii]|uniref:Cytochrome C n=1 Tax=Bythopirellula goksoeyrii TaxID=1400387 RepID=A0A5B9QLF0_9BACT|nr:dual specificity protein phosphatase family protein [Bythopirellula goksoeyrii]QEG34951.1 hypothetical protein Pr1d_22400 [Bythopirellula goksoeyrii]